MKLPGRNEAGMGLVEVIISLGVITVGLVALVAAMPLGTSLIGEANRKTAAGFLAQQRLEQIKNAKWNIAPAADCLGASVTLDNAPVTASWANCPGAAPPGLVTYPDEAFNSIAGYGQFRRQVRIRPCDAGTCGIASNVLRRVIVTVTFAPMSGVGMSDNTNLETLELITLVTQRP